MVAIIVVGDPKPKPFSAAGAGAFATAPPPNGLGAIEEMGGYPEEEDRAGAVAFPAALNGVRAAPDRGGFPTGASTFLAASSLAVVVVIDPPKLKPFIAAGAVPSAPPLNGFGVVEEMGGYPELEDDGAGDGVFPMEKGDGAVLDMGG